MNLFGTDGIRNRVGLHPFTQEALPKLGHALGLWAQEKYTAPITFLFARDTRYSGPWISSGLLYGLLGHPITVYDAGILPTPAVFHLMNHDASFTVGIIISASHNPAEDNGIKLVDSAFGKLSSTDEQRICQLLTEARPLTDYSLLGREIQFPDAKKLYKHHLTTLFRPNFLEGKTIVLDCANGANTQVAPLVFKELGADVISIHNDPDGYNINKDCGATAPESLQKAVVAHKAFMGFAFDGDADRCMVVTQDGSLKDGDDLLAILRNHADYKDQAALVSTVLANYGLDQHLKSHQKKLFRAAVGDKHVLEMMDKEHLQLGGEPGGHLILKNHVRTSDGLLVALKVLETVEQTGNKLLETFEKFPQICLNVPITHKKDLSQDPFATFLKESKEAFTSGRLLVRYSGTEKVVRIMTEGRDKEQAVQVAQAVAHYLQNALS